MNVGYGLQFLLPWYGFFIFPFCYALVIHVMHDPCRLCLCNISLMACAWIAYGKIRSRTLRKGDICYNTLNFLVFAQTHQYFGSYSFLIERSAKRRNYPCYCLLCLLPHGGWPKWIVVPEFLDLSGSCCSRESTSCLPVPSSGQRPSPAAAPPCSKRTAAPQGWPGMFLPSAAACHGGDARSWQGGGARSCLEMEEPPDG
jgi:hypothetical protein